MFQYPKHEHITLGAVEDWGTNTNILRDPPRSLFTRRIDKVGQNTDINTLIDDSADRIVEGVQVFARGVNPMVSVSYNNQSNNAGSFSKVANRGQAFLPYTIMEGGAFRPPVRNPRDLLPLSRLPRVWFSRDAPISKPDYSKTKQQPNDYRAVRDAADMVRSYDIRPNQSASINVKSLEHFISDPKAAINEKHINVEGHSGTRSRDISSYTRDNVDRNKGAMEEKLISAFAQSNKVQERSQNLSDLSINEKRYIQNHLSHQEYTNPNRMTAQGLDQLSIDEKRYIQNVLQAPSTTNKTSNINAKTIDQLNDANRRMTVKDNMIQYNKDSGIRTYTRDGDVARPVLDELNVPQHSKTTQISDSRVYHRVAHDKDLEFERNRPMTSATANITKLEDLNSMNLSSREARLEPTLKKGGFHNVGYKPTNDRADLIAHRKETDKDRLRQSVNQQFTRFNY